MNVLIDTNVIFDALMSRAPFNALAERLFIMVAADNLNASITASLVTDIYYLLNKHLRDTQQAKEALSNLFSLSESLSGNTFNHRLLPTVSLCFFLPFQTPLIFFLFLL